MHKIKTVISSFGMSGMVFHGPILKVNNGFEVIGILERKAQKSSSMFPNAAIYRSFSEVLESDAELLIINTPDYVHAEMAQKALEAGKHVVVEKPFTKTSEQAAQLLQLAKSKNLILTVFQNRRWDSDFLTVKKILQSEMLGSIVEFESHFDRFRNFIQQNTWKEDEEKGAGALYNLGSHLIDQTLVLFGLPHAITADIRALRPDSKVDDSFTLWLNYPDKKVTLKSSYLTRLPGPKYTIHGLEGSFLKQGFDVQEENLKKGILPNTINWGIEPIENQGTIFTHQHGITFHGQVETLPGNYNEFYKEVYLAIREGKPVPVNPTDAMNTIKIIEAAFKSNAEKRTVLM